MTSVTTSSLTFTFLIMSELGIIWQMLSNWGRRHTFFLLPLFLNSSLFSSLFFGSWAWRIQDPLSQM